MRGFAIADSPCGTGMGKKKNEEIREWGGVNEGS